MLLNGEPLTDKPSKVPGGLKWQSKSSYPIMGLDKTKNYPIFWEGKGMGNPLLKKNEKRKNDNRFQRLRVFHEIQTID